MTEHSTTDLYYAAYLQCIGIQIIRTDSKAGRITFVFDVSVVNIEELKNAWYNQTGKVCAQPYANCIRTLKARCHQP